MISKDDIKHLKELSRVEFDEKETEALMRDMDAILGYVNKLSEVDVSNVPETTHAVDVVNIMRSDDGLAVDQNTERVVESFPEKEGNYL